MLRPYEAGVAVAVGRANGAERGFWWGGEAVGWGVRKGVRN